VSAPDVLGDRLGQIMITSRAEALAAPFPNIEITVLALKSAGAVRRMSELHQFGSLKARF